MESLSYFNKKSIDNDKDLGYSTSTMKKYWCHLCKKEFTKIYIPNIDIQCNYCGNTFCEDIDNNTNRNSESHPIHFEPFRMNRPNNNNGNNSNNLLNQILFSQGVSQPRSSHGLLDLILNFAMVQNYNRNLEYFINQIMMNDNNKYGNPPASQKAVDNLEKSIITEKKLKEFGFENSCPVCKDEFIINEECLLMPCQHHFHKDCLLPWLKERNSCPVCRYELPTDDEDFEKRKREKQNSNNNNNNNGNNSVNP
jgi:E3 ubiquitin-protein ligase RNF115/126